MTPLRLDMFRANYFKTIHAAQMTSANWSSNYACSRRYEIWLSRPQQERTDESIVITTINGKTFQLN
jgi:hypothetical protein